MNSIRWKRSIRQNNRNKTSSVLQERNITPCNTNSNLLFWFEKHGICSGYITRSSFVDKTIRTDIVTTTGVLSQSKIAAAILQQRIPRNQISLCLNWERRHVRFQSTWTRRVGQMQFLCRPNRLFGYKWLSTTASKERLQCKRPAYCHGNYTLLYHTTHRSHGVFRDDFLRDLGIPTSHGITLTDHLALLLPKFHPIGHKTKNRWHL